MAAAVDQICPVLGSVLLLKGIDGFFGQVLHGALISHAATSALEVFLASQLFSDGWSVWSIASVCIVTGIYTNGWMRALRPNANQSIICRDFYKGKNVWITGASSGIGEQLAKAFYMTGARVILSGRREKELERVRLACLQKSSSLNTPNAFEEPIIIPLDLGRPEDIAAKAEEARRQLSIAAGREARVDVLVNNAGVSSRALAEEMEWKVDQDIMMVNYLGPVALTKAVLGRMLKGGSGCIITISSLQVATSIGRVKQTGMAQLISSLAGSKHALHGFMDSLRAEVASRGVSVTVVCPGYVRTELSLNAKTASGGKHGVMDETTLNGLDPALVAQVVIAKEVSGHVAPYLRLLLPSLLEWVMRRRAAKLLPRPAH